MPAAWAHMHAGPLGTVPSTGTVCDAEGVVLDAAAVSEAHMMLTAVFQGCARGLEVVHTASGLPWWASIPLCTLALRLALMPLRCAWFNAQDVRGELCIGCVCARLWVLIDGLGT